MEETMLKYFSICAVLFAIGMSSANAQQHEAILQKFEIPSAGFDIVVAMAKPNAPAIDLRGQPDPGILYLAGGRLLLAYDAAAQALVGDAAAFLAPASIFYAEHDALAPPVAVYVVPTGKAVISAQR
jgi:hypothetical protein